MWAAALALLALLGTSASAEAFEFSGGVNVGGVLVGTAPHVAVSPYTSVSWTADSGFLFAAHEMMNILVAINKDGVGAYNQIAAAIG